MKKANGFISMSLIYAFFIVFIAIMFLLLQNYASDRILNNRISSDIMETEDKSTSLSCSYKANDLILNKSTTFAYLDGSESNDDYVSTIYGNIKLSCPGFYEVTIYSRKGEDVDTYVGGKGGKIKAIMYFDSQIVLQYYVRAQTYIRMFENNVYIDPIYTSKGSDGTASSNGANGERVYLDRNYILEPEVSYNETNQSLITIKYLGHDLT